MAGRRRASGDKPIRRARRYQRRRVRLDVELAADTSPVGQITAAADYVRGALGPTPSEEAAAPFVRELVQVGDRIYLAGRRAWLEAELAAAAEPQDRLAVAIDYVRAAVGRGPAEEAVTRLADQLVHRLVRAGDRLYRQGDT
jgi:hypothetical protein